MMDSRLRPSLGTLLLLVLLLTMTAWTIAASDWVPGLTLLWPTALTALAVGTLITRSTFRRGLAHLIGLGYGLAWIAFTSTQYLPRAAGAELLVDRLQALARHVGEWVWLLFRTGVGKDNFIFLLSLMVVFWLLGYASAWFTFRATRVLRVILPPGLVILVNLYYYGGRVQLAVFLYAYLFIALLYLVRINYMLREQQWRESRVGFDDDLRESFLRGGSIVTLVAIFVAWFVPGVTPLPQLEDLWRQVSKPIRSVEDSFNRLFSALEGEGPALMNPFGRTLGFGGPRSLGDTVLFDVFVADSSDNADALARYWRANYYDTYTGNGWTLSGSNEYVYGAADEPLKSQYRDRSNVRQTFTIYFPRLTQLFAAAIPVYFNRDAEADAELITVTSGSSGVSVYVDPSFIYSRDQLRAGDAYDVISSLSIADTDKLRAAGTDYPAWIAGRYLQLPNTFPQRVKDLARQVVTEADATSPFDQASALERWLRANIVYNEKIPGPAPGQDGVDYLLFESRAGYCDYYASAMATMARSLGIPARVVIGYARGQFEPEGNVYRVRERDAHSWVEVFFPDYGWIEFEPTAAQPLINRPVAADPTQPDQPAGPISTPAPREDERLNRFGEEDQNAFPSGSAASAFVQALPRNIFFLIVGLVVLTVVAIGGFYVYENRGLRRIAGSGWAYARLVRLSRWLGIKLRPYHTPYEQAALLTDAAPGSREPIDLITTNFVRETFGRDLSGGERVRTIYRKLRPHLWWAGLKRRIANLWRRRPAVDSARWRALRNR